MQNMIDNLINGNLTDAKAQAKRRSQSKIEAFLMLTLGWPWMKASATASYLKDKITFQTYCDTVKGL